MKALCAALLIPAWANSAVAAPCVGAAFDMPFPGAQNVAFRLIDVPSPLSPGFWQEGSVDGWHYKLLATYEGVLQSSRTRPEWRIDFSCRAVSSPICTQSVFGAPPASAQSTANLLQNCLRAPTPEPEQIASQGQAEEPEIQRCGLAALPPGRDEVILQKLLVTIGSDPGPADGIIGPNTTSAMVSALGPEATQLSLSKAIALLNDMACK